MSTHNIYHFQYEYETLPNLSQICSYGLFSKGLKNKFETAMVNEPSVFEPLKFYCMPQETSNVREITFKIEFLSM